MTDIENSCAYYVSFDVEGRSYVATFSLGGCSQVVPGKLSLVLDSGAFVAQGLTILNAGSSHQLDGGVGPDALSYVCF